MTGIAKGASDKLIVRCDGKTNSGPDSCQIDDGIDCHKNPCSPVFFVDIHQITKQNNNDRSYAVSVNADQGACIGQGMLPLLSSRYPV